MNDTYYSGDIDEQIKATGHVGIIPDKILDKILLLKKIQSEELEKKIKVQVSLEKKSIEDKENNQILKINFNESEKSQFKETEVILTKKEITKQNKIRREIINHSGRKILLELSSKDKIKLTPEDERKKLKGNKIIKFPKELQSTITYLVEKERGRNKSHASIVHANYKKFMNKRKKEELEKIGIYVLESEIHETWKLNNALKNLKGFKNIKPIHNLKEAKLEWINVQLSTKNIGRKELLEEAEKSLECMKNKKELAKIMNQTYEEINKKFTCDEIIWRIKIETMNNLKVDPKGEQKTEEVKIEEKREKASESQQYFSHK